MTGAGAGTTGVAKVGGAREGNVGRAGKDGRVGSAGKEGSDNWLMPGIQPERLPSMAIGSHIAKLPAP